MKKYDFRKSVSPSFETSSKTWNSLSNETALLELAVIPASLVLQVLLVEMVILDLLVLLVHKVLLALLVKLVLKVLRVARVQRVKR